MEDAKPTLHMIYGNIAAGKSTLAARLAEAPGCVLIAEDDWLARLFEGEIASVKDFLARAARLRAVVGPHVVGLLRAGVSVVLDFQANTVASRAWMRGLFIEAGAAHCLHVLDVPDAVCLARLRARNAQGAHPFAATEAQFHRIKGYMVSPAPEEGFEVQRHGG